MPGIADQKGCQVSSVKKRIPLPFIAREDFESISGLLCGDNKEFSLAYPTYEAWCRTRASLNREYTSGELADPEGATIREVRVDLSQLEKYLKREGCVPGLRALHAFVEEVAGAV
jgi:hypothetical protein